MPRPKKGEQSQELTLRLPDNARARGRTQPPQDPRAVLASIAGDKTATPTARTAAARTLAEMDGLLGKHQAAPGQGRDAVPVASLSRPELEAELARLRLRFAAPARDESAETPGA